MTNYNVPSATGSRGRTRNSTSLNNVQLYRATGNNRYTEISDPDAPTRHVGSQTSWDLEEHYEAALDEAYALQQATEGKFFSILTEDE